MPVRIDKQRATALRLEGFKYTEIAKMMGISEAWCKRNLKDIDKKSSASAIIKELAKRPAGVSEAEIRRVAKMKGKDANNIKKVVRRQAPNVLFRPDWIDITYPQESMDFMMELANALNTTLNDLVDEYQRRHPNTTRQSVMFEMAKLATPWTIKGGIEVHCDRLSRVVSQLTNTAPPL